MVVSPQDGMTLNKPRCWDCAFLPGRRVLLQRCRSSHYSLCPCTSDQCAATSVAEGVLHQECSVFWGHFSFFRMVVHVSNSAGFTGKGEANVNIMVWRELVLLMCWRSSLLHRSFSLDELGNDEEVWYFLPLLVTRKEVESRLSLKVWHLLPSSLFPRG